MRILFDQGTPVPLRRHSIDMVAEMGWSNLRDVALLDMAEENDYDRLITTDQSIPYQQSLAGRRLGPLILRPNSWPRIRTRIDLIVTAVEEAMPRTLNEVSI